MQNGLRIWADNPGDAEQERAARQKVAALDEAITTVQDLALLPGANVAHLRTRIVQIGPERASAVAELSPALTASLPLTELLSTGDDDVPLSVDLSSEFEAVWAEIGIDRQRELVRRLMESVVVQPGRGQERIELVQRLPRSASAPEVVRAHAAARRMNA